MSIPLPAPTPEAARHSAQLSEHIRSDIAAHDGWIPFSRYMELALYAPGLGYYTAGASKFGESGDFITAPELSPLFGRTLARQIAEIMAQSAPHVVELGAGSGKLATDMLGELERLGSLPESYSILEVSADLRERQQALLRERLPHLAERVRWLDELPATFSGAVVANEVLDALPVHLVHWRAAEPLPSPANGGGAGGEGAYIPPLSPTPLPEGAKGQDFFERGVSVSGEQFVWQERPIDDATLLQAAQQINVPDGYVSEICLAQRGLINSLAQRLQRGALVFIDYGFGAREFYHPQRSSGTLMCHYRHHSHGDPFYLPGLQDITAHVNFSDVAECGIDAGLELLGYTNHAFFLINCGIAELMQGVSPENLRDYLPLSAQLQKLTSPAEMGELFKVIALGRGIETPLCGFLRGDLTRSL
ncbi:MAG TPA: SAM-dependent methyltransferase [Gallionella sp.]|nr:SAM-dependent methyltransferase [Gallionella sp.]